MKPLFGDLKESELLGQVKDWLVGHGYTWWRMPIGPVLHKGGSQWAKNPLKGFPDVAGILKCRPGVLWACELKTRSGRLLPEQLAWHATLDNAGAGIFLARSVEQFSEALATLETGGRVRFQGRQVTLPAAPAILPEIIYENVDREPEVGDIAAADLEDRFGNCLD
jgi:hypothetical protein